MFNQPAAAAWPELDGALPERAEEFVGIGFPICEVACDLEDALPGVAPAHGERLGWPFPLLHRNRRTARPSDHDHAHGPD